MPNFKYLLSTVVCLSISFGAIGGAQAVDIAKYVAVEKQNEEWVVLSIGDSMPEYKEGIEIFSLPDFKPALDSGFKINKSPYGGIDCPIPVDKTIYTPCTSYVYSFVGANWFGLGGIRVEFSNDRLEKIRKSLEKTNEILAAQFKKNRENAEARKAQEVLKMAEYRKSVSEGVRLLTDAPSMWEEKTRQAVLTMSKMERGSEDSCKRDKSAIMEYDPRNDFIHCTFGGSLWLEALPQAGWIVTNKIRNEKNVVTDYLIKKVR